MLFHTNSRKIKKNLKDRNKKKRQKNCCNISLDTISKIIMNNWEERERLWTERERERDALGNVYYEKGFLVIFC